MVADLGPTTGVVALALHGDAPMAVAVDGATDGALHPFTALARDAARRAGHPDAGRVHLADAPAASLAGREAAAAAGARLGIDAQHPDGHPDGADAAQAIALRAACAALQAAPLPPHPHVVAAALTGQPHAVTHRYPPQVTALPARAWWVAVVDPAVDAPARGWAQLAPRTIDTRKAIGAARLLTGWLDAWSRGDAAQLLACSDDRIHDHAVLPHIPGAHPARNAALAAGACTVGLANRGAALAAIAPDATTARAAADAMADAWAAHRIDTSITIGPLSP